MLNWIFKPRKLGVNVYGCVVPVVTGYILGATSASWWVWAIALPVVIVTDIKMSRKYG